VGALMGRGEGLVGRVQVGEKEKGRRPWAGLPGEKEEKEKGEENGPARERRGREKERRVCKFKCF
jgi:hypothetical protein